ncbi:SDR family NAD(P)-dependent oxidoreductase [Lachnobacterium bovis]|uniref:Short-chain dehydrogenase n=1 Tax=Lachnobacterium bovis TaxID=140626 RepID=A0A1H9PRS0_9FIRM|nr:SDR family oxidoreductase [Lachnobacterium bovis]SER50914.1 hypothetical protein SAMN02910429_00278 [Lachnobacterium bovis]
MAKINGKKQKVAVITGASSGIGREFAYEFAREGYQLVLIARRIDRLEEIKKNVKTKTTIIQADITKPSDILNVLNIIKPLDISVFINNAGFGLSGTFISSDLQREVEMIELNVKAMHVFTKVITRKMIKQKHGYLLNIASSAGLFPAGPYMSTYYATKSYVSSLTLAIAEELKQMKSPIYIGCLCPGPVNTEFNDVAKVSFALKGISAKYCVKYTLRQMRKKKVLIVPTAQMKLAIFFSKFLPLDILIRLVSGQQKKKMG